MFSFISNLATGTIMKISGGIILALLAALGLLYWQKSLVDTANDNLIIEKTELSMKVDGLNKAVARERAEVVRLGGIEDERVVETQANEVIETEVIKIVTEYVTLPSSARSQLSYSWVHAYDLSTGNSPGVSSASSRSGASSSSSSH